jgi:hypothetical protein
MAERSIRGLPFRLSATEIITTALSHAAADMREEDGRAAKAGRPTTSGRMTRPQTWERTS